jgi:hypothetical protein
LIPDIEIGGGMIVANFVKFKMLNMSEQGVNQVRINEKFFFFVASSVLYVGNKKD